MESDSCYCSGVRIFSLKEMSWKTLQVCVLLWRKNFINIFWQPHFSIWWLKKLISDPGQCDYPDFWSFEFVRSITKHSQTFNNSTQILLCWLGIWKNQQATNLLQLVSVLFLWCYYCQLHAHHHLLSNIQEHELFPQ